MAKEGRGQSHPPLVIKWVKMETVVEGRKREDDLIPGNRLQQGAGREIPSSWWDVTTVMKTPGKSGERSQLHLVGEGETLEEGDGPGQGGGTEGK